MFINSLTIENFRGFENSKIDFTDKVTVIVGKNGSGKTSVLEAAAVSAGTLFNSFKSISKPGITSKDAHNQYFDMGNVIDVQPQYPVKIISEGEINGKKLVWERSLVAENGRTTIVNAKEMTSLSEEYQNRLMKGDKELILPLVAYYGTGRLWDQHREKKQDLLKQNTRTNGYIDSLDGSANIKLMLKWFQKMAKKESDSNKPIPEYRVVRSAMEKFFITVTGAEKITVDYNSDTLEIDISYFTEDRCEKIPLNQLSDGYRCAVSLVADIAYRMAVLNPALLQDVLIKTSGLVLIDEIDLHLHPAWQRTILHEISAIFPEVQFIVSTHAPAVIQSVRSENLIILENGHFRKPGSEIYGRDVNGTLKSIMNVKERPDYISDKFDSFYSYMDSEKYSEAADVLDNLEDLLGSDDSEIAACRVRLDLEQL